MTIYSINGLTPAVDPSVFIAPNATVIGDVRVGAQSSIWFQTVVRGDINTIIIGEHSNIQDASVLHVTGKHAVVIGDRVTAGHGVILHGCTIESDCLIGMGAIILDGAVVGTGSIIGAGALVPQGMNVPPGSLVMGVPGKVTRTLNDNDKALVASRWQHYIDHAQNYRQNLALEHART